MKMYLAGKITGDISYKDKFMEAEQKYLEGGNIIINPAWTPEGLTPAEYMRICFAMIDVSDVVVFLADYKESKGASLEFEYCSYTNKPVIFDTNKYGKEHTKNPGEIGF